MNVFVVCFLVCIVSTNAWMSFSGRKLFKFILYSMECEQNKHLNLNVTGVKVYFYDFNGGNTKMFGIYDAARGILSDTSLDKTKKLTLFIGGFKNHIHHPTVEKIRKAYENHTDSYFLIVDHSHYTNDDEGAIEINYQRAVKHVYDIGKAMGQMLVDLYKGGYSSDKIHCIGFSLGAQMLGHTGLLFIKKTGESLSRITGLDPAGPCFSNGLMANQLRSTLAKYVEVYHCNAGVLGTSKTFGDIDFFANGEGRSQPNCLPTSVIGTFGAAFEADCNHATCVDIWAATVNNKDLYIAWNDKAKMYEKNIGYLTKNSTMAGYWNPGNATGIYYFSTQ